MNTFTFNPPTGLLDTIANPTDPGSETAAREQVQQYFNALRDYINQRIVTFVNSFIGMHGCFCDGTVPNGWLMADGSAVSRATYADLFAQIGTTYGAGDGSTTFSLPDSRGLFVRDWDNRASGGIDNGRVLGSIQQDDNKPHTHAETGHGGGSSGASGSFMQAANTYLGGQVVSANDVTGSSGGTESRPKNIALLGCIFTGVFN